MVSSLFMMAKMGSHSLFMTLILMILCFCNNKGEGGFLIFMKAEMGGSSCIMMRSTHIPPPYSPPHHAMLIMRPPL